MRMFWMLFKKDIRRHREEYLVLLFVSVMLGLMEAFATADAFNRLSPSMKLHYSDMCIYLGLISKFLSPVLYLGFPALFVYSAVTERRTGQAYLTYSLPCRNELALLAKLASVVVMGTVIFLIGYSCRAVLASTERILFAVIFDFKQMLPNFFLMCGTLCAIEGFLSLIKRGRLLFGIGFSAAVFWIMMATHLYMTRSINFTIFLFVPRSVCHYNAPYHWIVDILWWIVPAIYPTTAALLMTAAGLLLTRKYRDM
jgi:hypothetical protein